MVEFELEAKREISSVKSTLETQLPQKSGCAEIATWAKSQPKSQLKSVCLRLESKLKSQFQKISDAIDHEISDLMNELRSMAPQLALPTKIKTTSVPRVSFATLVDTACRSLEDIRSEASTTGAEVGAAVTLGGIGFFFGGPIGAIVGGNIGRAVGKAFDDGSEALRVEVRPKVSSTVSETQRKLVAQAQTEFRKTIVEELTKVSASLQTAVTLYGNARKKIEESRPNFDALSAQCSESMCLLEQLRDQEA